MDFNYKLIHSQNYESNYDYSDEFKLSPLLLFLNNDDHNFTPSELLQIIINQNLPIINKMDFILVYKKYLYPSINISYIDYFERLLENPNELCIHIGELDIFGVYDTNKVLKNFKKNIDYTEIRYNTNPFCKKIYILTPIMFKRCLLQYSTYYSQYFLFIELVNFYYIEYLNYYKNNGTTITSSNSNNSIGDISNSSNDDIDDNNDNDDNENDNNDNIIRSSFFI